MKGHPKMLERAFHVLARYLEEIRQGRSVGAEEVCFARPHF